MVKGAFGSLKIIAIFYFLVASFFIVLSSSISVQTFKESGVFLDVLPSFLFIFLGAIYLIFSIGLWFANRFVIKALIILNGLGIIAGIISLFYLFNFITLLTIIINSGIEIYFFSLDGVWSKQEKDHSKNLLKELEPKHFH